MTECALVALRAAGQRARASERATVESARLPTVCPCGAPTRRGGVLHPARKAAWRASRQGRHSLPGRAESLPRALHPLRRAPAAPCRASARATTWTTPPSARMGGSSRCGGGGRRLGRARARARGTSGPAAKPATPRARRARESSAWSTPSAWTGIHRACVRSGGGGRQSGEVGHPKMREIFALAPSSSPCTRGLTPASLPSQVEYAAKAVDNSKYVCTTLRAARGLALLPRSLRLLAARARHAAACLRCASAASAAGCLGGGRCACQIPCGKSVWPWREGRCCILPAGRDARAMKERPSAKLTLACGRSLVFCPPPRSRGVHRPPPLLGVSLSTSVGICCKDGVVLGVQKEVLSKMLVAGSGRRIATVDRHAGMALSGLPPDGRQVAQVRGDAAAVACWQP